MEKDTANKTNQQYFTQTNRTAVLFDGAFFIKQYRRHHWNNPNFDPYDAKRVRVAIYGMVKDHLQNSNGSLYRIIYYDCPPLTKKIKNPINGLTVDLAKSKQALFMNELFDLLKKGRKVALRLGVLNDPGFWTIKQKKTKELLNHRLTIKDLTPDDIEWVVNQKQVDMKMGLDVASLAYKKLVDQIIMISGDADFVPVAKVARREGIDFILDPMFKPISPELSEHVDGLYSPYCRRKTKKIKENS